MRTTAGRSHTDRSHIAFPLRLGACALLLAALALSSCGGGSSSPATQSASFSNEAPQGEAEAASQISTRSTLSPSTVVATVGDQKITWAMLRHKMSEGKHEVPESPGFAACVAHGGPASATKPVSSGPGGSGSTKARCEKAYRQMVSGALGSLIQARWVLGEGKDRGFQIDEAELRKELAQVTTGAFKQGFASSGLTIADVRRNIETQQIIDRLFADVKAKTPEVTQARVAAYYKSHEHDFAVPEERDIDIVRTASSLAAQKALEQIKGGESFADVVKHISLPQPINTIAGTFHGLTLHYFSEPVLSDAIFKARPHVLSGPVHINLGYYVYEVIAVRTAHQKSLAESQAAIQRRLPELLHTQVLASAVGAYREKWTAKTSCKAGFFVQGCREFKAGPGASAADPYAF